MATILVATPGQQTEGKSKISWLFEDIWTDDKGDGDILLECIIESHDVLKEIYLVLPYHVKKVDDLSYLYFDPSFTVDGYPHCWLDIYHQFKVEPNKDNIVTINGVTAKVGKIKVSIEDSSLKCSMIKVEFDPLLKNNESIVFRLGLLCEQVLRKGLTSFSKKQIKIYSYGIASYATDEVKSMLKKRDMIEEEAWIHVDKHIIAIEVWKVSKSPVVLPASLPPARYHYLEKCDRIERSCPPLERMALRSSANVEELKNRESLCAVWEFNNLSPVKGQSTLFSYYSSEWLKWLAENYISLLALFLSSISFLFIFLRWIITRYSLTFN